MATDLAEATIAQIAVCARDVDRALEFYRDRLGLPFLFQFPGLAFLQAGGVRLLISKPETPEYDHPGSVLYLKVADIDAVHATLAGRGVRFKDEPHVVHRTPEYHLWMTFFDDTEGNPLALMCEKPISA